MRKKLEAKRCCVQYGEILGEPVDRQQEQLYTSPRASRTNFRRGGYHVI